MVPKVFEGLPFELDLLYPELDGTFPHHPADPIQPENLRDLQARVRATGADVGLAFDGTPTGCSWSTTRPSRCRDRPRPRSWPPASSSASRGPRSCTTSSAPRPCPRSYAVRRHAGADARSATRSSSRSWPRPARPSAASTRALLLPGQLPADSGSIAALVVLERICKAGVPLSQLRRPFDRYAASGEINTSVDDPAAVIDRVAAPIGCRPGPRGRSHRRPGRLVVQPAAVEHRAAAAAQPRGSTTPTSTPTSPRSGT